jgi:histone-lysine N-methyltransferase SETMAR
MATGGAADPVFSREEQRAVIRFFFHKGMTGTAIHRELRDVLGENALSLRAVYQWVEHFKEGRTDTQDVPRTGRPSVVNDDLVSQISTFVRENRSCTLENIEAELPVKRETARSIIHDHLGMRKLQSQWVPHNLSEEQKERRVTVCKRHLLRAQKEGDKFFERIVAGDETWVKSFEPELKQQTSLWRGSSFGKGEVHVPQHLKPTHPFKIMHIIFFDFQGIIIDHPVPSGTRVTAEYYRDFIREKLRPAIRKKRPLLLEEGPIVLHDNARPHVAEVVTTLLASYGWEVLEHPAYSPDLSPCDFFLFGKLKAKLRGQSFGTEDAINRATKNALMELATGGLREGIFGLQKRWELCVRDEGRYTEA